ncbi:MAG: phage tail protein [Rickettsiales bacterium]|nr:phage tail protein [Rickettsiales bacterium]
MANRRAGIVYIKVDGNQYDAKGNFEYNIGNNIREAIVGSDGVHGYKEMPQVPFIEGAITDSIDLDLKSLQQSDEATVTLELGNGKTIMLENAWYAGEGTASSEEAEIPFRFEGLRGEELV